MSIAKIMVHDRISSVEDFRRAVCKSVAMEHASFALKISDLALYNFRHENDIELRTFLRELDYLFGYTSVDWGDVPQRTHIFQFGKARETSELGKKSLPNLKLKYAMNTGSF